VCGQELQRAQINSQERRKINLLHKETGKDFLVDLGNSSVIAKGLLDLACHLVQSTFKEYSRKSGLGGWFYSYCCIFIL
jgi:hypothetical protein